MATVHVVDTRDILDVEIELARQTAAYDAGLPPAVRSIVSLGTRTSIPSDPVDRAWVAAQLAKRRAYHARIAKELGLVDATDASVRRELASRLTL
jgi:hypothetical protein